MSIEGAAAIMCWAGRLVGLAIVGLVVLFLIGTGGFNPLSLRVPEALEMTFLFATCIGLLLAWRWEWVGGSLAVAGVMLFQLVELIVHGRLFTTWVFGTMLLAGVLVLLSQMLPWLASKPSRVSLPS